MEELEPALFKPIASLIPGQVGFVFRVPDSEIGKFTLPTPFVTTYADFEGPGRLRRGEYHWDEMIFTHNETGPGNYMSFYFHEDRSGSFATKVGALSYPDNQPHTWDNVLVHLSAIEDPTQPLTFEVGGEVLELPRLFERYYKVPESTLSTDIEVEVFVSHKQFPRPMVKTDIPVPGHVRWSDRNARGDLICLHGHVEFPELQTGGARVPGWGTTKSRSPMGSFSRRVYKPTNHPTWKNHIRRATPRQDPETGLWVLTRERVLVPAGFDAIKQLSN